MAVWPTTDRWRVELPVGPLGIAARLVQHLHLGTRGDTPVPEFGRWGLGISQPGTRSRVLPRSPAIPLASNRRGREPGVHPIPLSAAMALRRASRARARPCGWRSRRSAAGRCRHSRPARTTCRWDVARSAGSSWQDVVSDGTGRPQPLGDLTRSSGPTVVGGAEQRCEHPGGRTLTPGRV